MRFSFAWDGVVCKWRGEAWPFVQRHVLSSLLLTFGELEKWNNPVHFKQYQPQENTPPRFLTDSLEKVLGVLLCENQGGCRVLFCF